MKLASYVVRWDHGFAPNPFHGICTLATCKPGIRKYSNIGDWVLGTGSAERNYSKRAIFLMKIDEIINFDEYWNNPRFFCKKPVMNGSLKQRFGDNIYYRNNNGDWHQANSRHSQVDGANDWNIVRDTGKTDRVLIGHDFIYWGDAAPMLPPRFQNFVMASPGYANHFEEAEVGRLLDWAWSQDAVGQVGDPLEWRWEQSWAKARTE